MKFRALSAVAIATILLFSGCDLLDPFDDDDFDDDDALKRCVITGHAVGGGACLPEGTAASLTKAQCETQDDAWDDAHDDNPAMTCEADWD